ncbi:MAG: CBS domain-containing protein [Planctomycetes bacterium]|nr:CBS domain-containing protein [Planctomycetota bacterium]
MKTIELMSTEPRSVRVVDRLDAAARAMWEGDCGIVPVLDGEGAVVGVITDRDLCMASYTQGRALSEIPVAVAMARKVVACRPDESVAAVMQTMQQLRVHRLPVVDARNKLVGMISTNDLVRAAHARPAAVDPGAVVRTLATIGSRRDQELGAVATDATGAKERSGDVLPTPAEKVPAAGKRATKDKVAKPARQAAKPRSGSKAADKAASGKVTPRKSTGNKSSGGRKKGSA